MTDQGELRDRIAEAIYREDFGNLFDNPAAPMPLSSQSPGEQAIYRDLAQAIIDDLGLTVEAGKVMDSSDGFPGVPGTRVVGKWEKNE